MRNTPPKVDLSPREEQLIALAGEGLTDTAIANRLGISEATVNTYWGRIRVKLGPHNRTELVAIALREEYERKLSETPDYSAILRAAPDAMLLISEEGSIEDANEAAGEMFGYDLSELVGMNLAELMPERMRRNHDLYVASYMEQPERRQMGSGVEVVGRRKCGEEFSISAAISAVDLNGKSMAICSIRQTAP